MRYLLMTSPSGTIIDDGIACRFDDEHFYVTATTGGVDNVHRTMLWWNAQWRLDVDVTNITPAYAGVNLAGPKSRVVLQRVCNDIDLTPEGFPYLAVRTATVANIPARLLRVGFVGELGYEIHVPSSQGEALWDALLDAGDQYGIQPVGTRRNVYCAWKRSSHCRSGYRCHDDSTRSQHGMGNRWGKPFL